jgi:hypothetical protein
LGLHEAARATGLSVLTRSLWRRPTDIAALPPKEDAVYDRADRELAVLRKHAADKTSVDESISVPIDTSFGRMHVDIADPAVKLAREFWRSIASEGAMLALRKADSELDRWEQVGKMVPRKRNIVTLPFGVEVWLPEDFERLGIQ